MLAYSLTYLQDRTPDQQYVYKLELTLEVSHFPQLHPHSPQDPHLPGQATRCPPDGGEEDAGDRRKGLAEACDRQTP